MTTSMKELEDFGMPEIDPSSLEKTCKHSGSDLPPGWVARRHKFNNWTYFFHEETQAAVWTKPYVVERENEGVSVELDEHPIPPGVIRFRRRERFGEADTLSEDEKETKKSEKDSKGCHSKRETPIVFNPAGKTPVTFLQEYSIHTLKSIPKYFTAVQDDPFHPFITKVVIDGKEYSSASFTNKKQSKQMAAEATLLQLCPDIWKSEKDNSSENTNNPEKKAQFTAEEFENLPLSDERITLSVPGCKSPAQIIQEYCNRNSISVTWGEQKETDQFTSETKFQLTGKIQLKEGGEVEGAGKGKSKKEAKQNACHSLVQNLHPECKIWRDVLELYALRTKENEKMNPKSAQITPNLTILSKLKEKMGALFPPQFPSPTPTPSLSSSPPPSSSPAFSPAPCSCSCSSCSSCSRLGPPSSSLLSLGKLTSSITTNLQPKLMISNHNSRMEKKMVKRKMLKEQEEEQQRKRRKIEE